MGREAGLVLTWVPWVWIKRIGLAGVVLAIGTVLTLYIVIRPRPVAPSRDWTENWNQLGSHDENADASALYEQASSLYDHIAGAWASSTADDAPNIDEFSLTERLESFRFGEWGHEAHRLGIEWHSQLGDVINLCLDAATMNGADWSIEQRIPETAFEADEISGEMLLHPLMLASGTLSNILFAEMRIASNLGETERATRAFDAALALAEHAGSGPALIHKLSGALRCRLAISHAVKIALSQEANAETIAGFIRVLEDRAALPLDIDDLMKAERLVGELSIWRIYMEAQEASIQDVLASGIGAVTDPGAEEKPTLWTLRRLRFQSLVEFNDLYQQRSRELWTLSPESFASAPKEPVFKQAPELFKSDLINDPVFRFRRSFVRHEIENHSDHILLHIALYIAKNGTPPARLDELHLQEDVRVPFHTQAYIYELDSKPPGFSLRLPNSAVLQSLETEFDISENTPFAGSERAVLFRSITDDTFLTDWFNER